ncbi:MAG: HAMP domain-containing histidine kinase [Lachnospiraceae bacterium]|nr:HAMP domain-containing histidine kinase [Lachnospiraceae bacterium]
MTFKTKLAITFLAIVVIPITLCAVTVVFVTKYQQQSFLRDFGIESDTYGMVMNTVQLFSGLTEEIYEKIQNLADDDPNCLEKKSVLDDLNGELSKKSSFLVVRKGCEIYYTGNSEKTKDIKDILPAYGAPEESNYSGEMYVKNLQMLIKQEDFRFKDHSRGSIFIVTNVSDLIPRMRTLTNQIGMAFVVILILTGLALVSWIYTGMVSPLKQITEAAEKIGEGTLDFELKVPDTKDEVAQLCKSFEEMRKRLKESADSKINSENENRALVTNITHDLKTPVTSIKGYAEGLMDGVADTPERREKYIKTIYNKANDMDRLINELTFYAGIDNDRIPYNFVKLDISDYFNDCADELETEIESRGMKMQYDNTVEPGTKVIADPVQFKKVINNIVGNSIKYMDKTEGRISIFISDTGEDVKISIGDNGCGIESKDLPYIFDRFYRADASRNSAKGGSGVGLSIVKKIVEDHGGKVWAESDGGEGTVMCIELKKYKEQG